MPATRWLDDEEQRAWRAFLGTCHLLQDVLDKQLQRDAGMPHAYYIVLAMLSEAPGRTLRMSQLARRVFGSQSRVSHAVARLEERGWVRRERHPQDHRGQLATLTDEGYAVLVAAAPGHVSAVRENLFDRLTGEQVRQLSEICDAALERLDPGGAYRRAPAPPP
jgi:DNA-binding MarR family transcriptional regulator